MTTDGNRLERALALHLHHQQLGGDRDALLRAHPDLADLLQAFAEDEEPPSDAASVGAMPATIGDYRLEHELGRGGNGVVHAAVDRRFGRPVALKLLHVSAAGQPTAVARFLREAQMLARLDHPAVVRVFDLGSHQGRPWLAMERIGGVSLAQRIAQLRAGGGHAGDSLRELVAAVAEVADALTHVHAAGIVHRDVKPSNLLLRADGSAVLTDFGIARDEGDPALTQTGIMVGSPHYMAPEQTIGSANDHGPAVDVFALGATLYECITLQRAFDGATAQAVIQAILHRDPPDLRRHQRGLPHDLVAIVGKALEKDPAHRYPTAAAFAADLRAFLELREVEARAATRLTRWWRRARREPVFGATAALALSLGVVLVWLALQWPQFAAVREAERQRVYESATTAGFLARSRGGTAGREDFVRALELVPERAEAVVGLVFVAHRGGGAAAALEALDAHAAVPRDAESTAVLQRCRAWLLRASGREGEAAALEAGLPPPRTSLDLWLQSLLLTVEPTQAALAEARSLLSLAVRTAPQPNLLLHVQWTKLVVRAGSAEERREAAEALLRQWPEHPVALHLAGVALLQVDAERAVALLRAALERGETDPLGAVNLGIAEALTGDVTAAVATLRRAFAQPLLQVDARVQVLLTLGQLQASEVADELAEAWFLTAPDSPDAARFAARAAHRRGEHDLARSRFAAALAQRPDDAEIRLDLVQVLRQAGDRAGERAELEALAVAHPVHARVHRQLVDSLQANGDPAAQRAELRRWTAAQPEDAAGWSELAAGLLAAEDPAALDEALSAAERADYLLRGEDAATLELRAAILERLGGRAEAERLRRRAAALLAR